MGYRTLKDAAAVTGDRRYGSGSTEVWYYQFKYSRDLGMGADFAAKHSALPDPKNLDLTHVYIGNVNETNPERVWEMMQGEFWSPMGEARTLPGLREASHTSMSVGDVIVLPGKTLMVDRSGYFDLKEGMEMTVNDRSDLIRLASELPAGDETRRAILAGLTRVSARKLSDIAREIRKDWKKVYFGAVPYLEAMAELDSIKDNYGQDSAKSIVTYFLSNATTWKGDVAKQIKAELKAMIK